MNEKRVQERQDKLIKIESKYKEHSFPPSVLVEVTAHCNINCIQCANSKLTRPKGYMDINLYKKIVDEIAQEDPTINFWLAFYGEPLLLKYKLFYMLWYAKQRGLTNIYLNTNGMLLSSEMIDMLLDGGLDHIIIGVDGYTAQTFESIRVGAKRDVVYKNVNEMLKKKRERKLVKPKVEIQFIVMDENKHELEAFKKFWLGKGACIKIRNMVTWSGHVGKERHNSVLQERKACGWAVGTCPITWDGKLVACGTDCDANIVFGDINLQTIKDIWNNMHRKFVQNHLSHQFDQLPGLCKNCTDWSVIGTEDYDEEGNRYKKVYR